MMNSDVNNNNDDDGIHNHPLGESNGKGVDEADTQAKSEPDDQKPSISHHPLSNLTLDDGDDYDPEDVVSTSSNYHSTRPLLDSPSFADVITPSPSEFATSFPPRSQEYLEITVSDPQKELDSTNSLVPGSNTYITYLISTNTNIPDYEGTNFTVRRRFKDIVVLSDRLSESYRGFFITPRPDKSVVESQVMHKHEFVEQRRVELEKYLRRLAKHPVIRKSDELRVFLTINGRMPLVKTVDVASRVLDGAVRLPKQLFGDESKSVVGPEEAVRPAKSGRDLLRYLKELKQSVVNDWGNLKPGFEEEDKEFLEKKERLWSVEKELTNASKQAESLVKAQQDMGDTMGELGLAFIKLTKFENEQAVFDTQRVRATCMKSLATAAVKASRLHKSLNTQTVNNFETLHEYMGLMLAAHNAFADRSSALLTVQTLMSELSSMHAKAEKLETASYSFFGGGDKSRIRKQEDLKDAIRVTEDAKCCAIREYERIKENNRSEIERLDQERQIDFVNMLKGFVTNQVAYHEKISSEWAKVAEETRNYEKENSQSTSLYHTTANYAQF